MDSKPTFDVNQLRIAAPCRVSWAAMSGDERKRLCGECRLHVYNVAELTRDEVRALVGGGDDVCMRLYRRADGTVITRDCPLGQRVRDRMSLALGAVLAALAAGTAGFVTFGDELRGRMSIEPPHSTETHPTPPPPPPTPPP
ncbi:MAG: hypothetical protein ACK4N5_27030, partial [Myxococcales bacterium]